MFCKHQVLIYDVFLYFICFQIPMHYPSEDVGILVLIFVRLLLAASVQRSRCFQSLDFLFYDILVKPWAAKTANRANIGASAVPPKPPKPKHQVLPHFLAVGSNRQNRQNVLIYETIVNQLLLSDVFQNTKMFNTCSCRA